MSDSDNRECQLVIRRYPLTEIFLLQTEKNHQNTSISNIINELTNKVILEKNNHLWTFLLFKKNSRGEIFLGHTEGINKQE